MKPYTTVGHVNSLNGENKIITVIDIVKNNSPQTTYIVDFEGVKCTAILNPFNGHYYVDDIYGKIENEK